ncbi:MAG TPA: trigger factor [Actinomycetota bacterium]|nr:trigger factor [Actinomycetota bacterium]
METTLEDVGKHRVKLSVDVPPEETRPVLDLAYRHLAGSVSVPGFRKGKAPRRVIEAQLGEGAVLREFLDHALPDFYLRAVREHGLAPVGEPEFDDLDVGDVEKAGLRFTATIDVRPRVEFSESDYKGLRLERPSTAVSDGEVDEQMDRLRDRFAQLESVGHPARPGDFVVADITATSGGEDIPGVGGQGVLYEIGTEQLGEAFDKELEGTRPGGIHKVTTSVPPPTGEGPGREVSFSILVKEVKAKRLPALDDEFARTASEFDTLDELREDVRSKLATLKEARADAGLREEALRVLSQKVADVEVPDSLVDRETESRVESARRRLQQQGATLEQFLQATGTTELEFRSDARGHAVRAIRADLALEAVARAEDLTVTDEDLDQVVVALAKDVDRPVKEVRRQLEASGQVTSLAGDIIRDRALNLVVENAEVIAEGEQTSEAKTEGKA